MTSERTVGLIVRTRLLTETSLIVHWITPDQGRLATVAKGARRPNSPFRGKLDLFYTAEFSFQRSRRSDLHTLREVSLCETRICLRQEYARLRQAAYGALLVEQVTETDTPIPAIYDLLVELLDCLNANSARTQYLLAFELKLLAEVGQKPDLTASPLSPLAQEWAQRLLTDDLLVAGQAAPPPKAVLDLQQFLHRFLVYHLDHVPRGRAEALQAQAAIERG